MNEIKKITDEEYFKSDGLSNSYLLKFERSPSHALVETKKTTAINNGTLCHDFILQKELFQEKYCFLPEEIKDKRTITFKTFAEENYGKIFINFEDKQFLELLEKNILSYELIPNLTMETILKDCKKEISIFWEDEIDNENGIQIIQKKGKIDILYESKNFNLLIDLKKTQDCLKFDYSVRDYKLYRQAAWYSEGATKLTGKESIFIFLTFEYEPPFGIMAYQIDDSYQVLGQIENEKIVKKWLDWKRNCSPELIYKNGINKIIKPEWFGK